MLDIEGTECIDDDVAHDKARDDLRRMVGEILGGGELVDVIGIRVHSKDARDVASVDVKEAIAPYFAQAFFAVRDTDWQLGAGRAVGSMHHYLVVEEAA